MRAAWHGVVRLRVRSHSQPPVVWGTPANNRLQPTPLQRPLRSRFQARLSRSVGQHDVRSVVRLRPQNRPRFCGVASALFGMSEFDPS